MIERKCSTLHLKPDMNRSWLDPRPGGWARGIDPDGDIDYFVPVNEGDPSTLPVRYVLVAPLPSPTALADLLYTGTRPGWEKSPTFGGELSSK